MSTAIDRGDVARFRAVVAERLGLQIGDDRLGDLAALLDERLHKASGADAERYLAQLAEARGDRRELGQVAAALTVGETYFLRNMAQFEALADVVQAAIAARRELHILSAGCASGEEAYSIAILLRERFGESAAPRAVLRGFDVNPVALRKAVAGRYSKWSLRELSPPLRERYFVADRGDFVVDESIRRAVSFEERNLASDDDWPRDLGAFDVIFCRNVIMYFTPSAARDAVERLARSLAPGGHLFLGHAESMRGISERFALCQAPDAFFYRLAAPTPAAGRAEPGPNMADWTGAIQRASEHIELLAVEGERARAALDAPSVDVPALDVGADAAALRAAWALLRAERFKDALARLDELSPAARAEPQAALLRAALLTHAGDLVEAEELCLVLLARSHETARPESLGSRAQARPGSLAAAAHHLVALCRARAGDVAAALASERAASRADPAFVMSRMHLGILLKGTGMPEAACAEFRAALVLLPSEDARNVDLFGGGFTRGALADVCHAELRSLAKDG